MPFVKNCYTRKALYPNFSRCLFDTNTPPMSCQLPAVPTTQTEQLQADKAGELGRANNQLVHSQLQMELGRFLAPRHKKVAIKQ